MKTTAYKEAHDLLLALKPEDEDHECPLCDGHSDHQGANHDGGVDMSDTYTKDQLEAAVTEKTAELQAQLEELQSRVADSEVGKAVAEAIEPLEAKIAELEQSIDAAEVKAKAAEDKLTETEEFWAQAISDAKEAEELKAKRDERKSKVVEAKLFSEEKAEERADRWAAMSEEDFDAVFADLVAARNTDSDEIDPPGGGVFSDAADTGGDPKGGFAIDDADLGEYRRDLVGKPF